MSADRAIGVLAVAVLLVGLKSGTPGGAVTVAVFVRVPGGVFVGNVPSTKNVTVLPGNRLTLALSGPVPPGVQSPVRMALQTQERPASAGTPPLSVTRAPTTA